MSPKAMTTDLPTGPQLRRAHDDESGVRPLPDAPDEARDARPRGPRDEDFPGLVERARCRAVARPTRLPAALARSESVGELGPWMPTFARLTGRSTVRSGNGDD